VDAVERGMFSVFAAETIEDAVTIMTGVQAGQRDENDDFPPGSLFDRVDQRLLKFAEAQVAFGKEDRGETAS